MLIMHQLARVLLNMNALNPNHFGLRVGVFFIQTDHDFAFTHDGVIELRNLIALRQIGVEIILPIKPAPRVDLGINCHARAHSLAHAFAVQHRQHPRHRCVDEGNLTVRLCPESRVSPRKQLGFRRDLGVNFQANHDLPFACCALDAVV